MFLVGEVEKNTLLIEVVRGNKVERKIQRLCEVVDV